MKSIRRFGTILLVLLAVAGPVLGLVAYRIASFYEQEQMEAGFNDYLAERAFDLQREIGSAVELLHGIRSLFESSVEVTRSEFATYTRSALERHEWILALEWAPLVNREDRDLVELRARGEGLSGYVITEMDDDKGIVPAAPRDLYFPVYYVEPREPNSAAIGFDLHSEETRRRGLAEAMGTESASLTGPIRLIQETGSSLGFIAIVPVYRNSALDGFVLSVVRMQDLLQHSLHMLGHNFMQYMEFELQDIDVPGRPRVLFASVVSGNANHGNSFTASRAVDLPGRSWLLKARPTDAFCDRYRTSQPVMLGIGAFLVWEMGMGLLLGVMGISRASALRKRDEVLCSVLTSVADGVVVADSDGKILLANKAARQMVEMADSSVPPEEWANTHGLYRPDDNALYSYEELPLSRAISGEEVRDQEVLVRNARVPDGVWVSVNGTPWVGENGKVIGGTVVFRDVTARRKARERLQVLLKAVDQTTDIVFITDRDGLIEYVNPAFESTTGFSREEAVGKTPAILKSGNHGAEYYRKLWAVILAGNVHRASVINRKKNGELFHAEQTITPVANAEGEITHFVSVVKDMTDRMELEKRRIEMDLAWKIQNKLYPGNMSDLSGLEIIGTAFPAVEACGDYFDYFKVSENSVVVAIGDVVGHGVGPALLMAETRAYIRVLAQTHEEPHRILSIMNAALSADLEDNHYVTLLLARIDLGSRKMTYANAGHTPGIILDPSGNVRMLLESGGPPLGMFSGTEYLPMQSTDLEAGEVAVLLTDGFEEAEGNDGSRFGKERVLGIVRANTDKPAKEITNRIRQAVGEFSDGNPQLDDQTVVVCKMTETALF